jgi:serine phosphatase RsbU (regulator of sigma subunit)
MKRIVYLLLFQIFYIQSTKASEIIILSDSLHELCVCRKFVDYFVDPSNNLNLSEIISKNSKNFQASTAQDLVNANIQSTYWLRFRISNHSKNNLPYRVELFDFDIDKISFFHPKPMGKYCESVAGFNYPFSQREIAHKNISFNISVEKEDTLTFYMRFYSRKLNVLEPIIRSYDRMLSYGFTEYLLFGLFYGLLLLMIFYNALYYFILRKKHSVFYVLYAIGILIYLVSQNGIGFQYFWFNFPNINPYISNIGLFLGIESMLLFTISFLELRTRSRKLFNLFVFAIVNRAILFIIQLAFPTGMLWGLTDLVFIQLAFVAGLHKVNSETRSVIWFVIAFCALNIAFLIAWLEHIGVLNSGIFTVYALNIGVILQFLFLSIGIAESVKETYRLKNEAQANLIVELEINEALKAKANQELEKKVKERTLQLEQQKYLVEDKNTQIMASVRAAKNIQTAILPNTDFMKSILDDYFALYMPRDIVSGDFYWLHSINENEYLIAAVDCTGHGVPGAFMSMIGINLLNRIVSEGTCMPDKILLALHRNIQKVLQQDESKNMDGMDMALCYVNKQEKKLYYSGAKNALLYIQNNQIHKIPASKFPIGGVDQSPIIEFTLHEISFKEFPILFYLFSDGYIDQFGGPQNKKFLIKNFIQLLDLHHSLPLEEQKAVLKSTIKAWMGDQSLQIDDILVLGVNEI